MTVTKTSPRPNSRSYSWLLCMTLALPYDVILAEASVVKSSEARSAETGTANTSEAISDTSQK